MISSEELKKLSTEARNPRTMHIDECTSLEIVRLINEEDKTVADAVRKQEKSIAKAIDVITEHIKEGGRLFYIGAGTSGRIGMLDASECPPTFGVDSSLVCGIMAGGLNAFQHAVEGLEDNCLTGRSVIKDFDICIKDVVVGIAASGRTPFVIGALKEAKDCKITTIGISNTVNSEMENIVDIPINVPVGPEVITGSTRMKAGTAQKLILNMLTTGSMIRLGKVYQNLMVDLKATNEKLVERARCIICEVTKADYETSSIKLKEADNCVPVAIIMIMKNCKKEQAKILLNNNNGSLTAALKEEVFYHD